MRCHREKDYEYQLDRTFEWVILIRIYIQMEGSEEKRREGMGNPLTGGLHDALKDNDDFKLLVHEGAL